MLAHLKGRSVLGALGLGIVLSIIGFAMVTSSQQVALAATSDCGEPYVIAHRGNGEGANENTLFALNQGIQNGADATETDIRRTRGGMLGLMHNKTTGKTMRGPNYTVARMGNRLFKSRVTKTAKRLHPPALSQWVDVSARKRRGMQLHLKVGFSDRQLVNMGRNYRQRGFTTSDVQLNSDNIKLLVRAKKKTGYPVGYTHMGTWRNARIDRLGRLGIDVVVVPKRLATKQRVAYAKSRGIELGARAHSISYAWAKDMGICRLVVDRWNKKPAPEPTPTPTPTVTPTTPSSTETTESSQNPESVPLDGTPTSEATLAPTP